MKTHPLRVGIIGCGNIGSRMHLPTWLAHADDATVVALADPAPTALDAARTTAGLARDQVHHDPRELIERADVDVVDICTPQHLRRGILVDAAKAGKHILCEKPIAVCPADAAAAITVADELGTTLAMVHNYLWLPEILAARRVIDSGEIGQVRTVIVNYLGVVDVPGAATYRADWRHDVTIAGGGVLMDMLHGVYLAEALLGEPIRRVSSHVDRRGHDGSVEDLALCRFETETNAGLVNIGWGMGPGGIDVSGTGGRVAIRYQDGGTAPWAPLEHVLVSTAAGVRTELAGEERGAGVPSIPPAIFASFGRVVLDFIEAVHTGRPVAASGADGQRVLEATVGAYESAATGRIVTIPLDPADPVYQHGALGIQKLPLPEWSIVRRQSLYNFEAR
jgi:predicted dehydrogenase